MSTPLAADGTEITVGTTLPPWLVTPTTIQLFRFSAVTWNAHRIHYDAAYAREEGYPDVLVQSHLHGCFLVRRALEWAGEDAVAQRIQWQNRDIAVPGQALTITGSVTGIEQRDDQAIVQLDLEERRPDGALCAPGTVVIAVPLPGAQR